MALVGVVVINYILVPKKQKLEATTTVSKYKSERVMLWSTVVYISFPFLFFKPVPLSLSHSPLI